MPAFLSRNYYCHTCKKGYQHKEEHRCNNICTSCHKIHEKKDDDWIYCNDCNRHFYGEECYRLHAQTTRKGNSTCKSYIRCKICSQTINKKMHKKEHICGEIYCKTCKDFYEVGHLCFMLPVEGDKFTEYTLNDDMDTVDEDETKNQVYIFFDFECTQDDLVECEDGFKPERGTSKCKNCKKSKCGTYEHKPNLCVVQQVCLECLKEDLTPLSVCENCGKNELIFSGMNTTYDFCQWLFSGENNGATVICHNFKGYDSFPILQYLYQNGVLPKIVPSGAKNMSIEVPSCNIRMIDSLNFLPMALSKLPKMFGIKELQKGYFPHLYNRKENQTSVLNQLPDVKFYNPDAMKSEDRENFLEWYQTNVKVMFDFQKELLKYCRSDVDILRRCCLRFRELFMSMTKSATGDGGIDPFETCITIASACNLVFRTKFLRADTIGIIPAQGYRPEEKHSVKAIQWIKYISQTKGVDIQHARNGREKIIDQYRVDGFYENSEGEKIVLEYHGCFWHGCPTCYTQHTINTVNKLSMEDLYHQTMEKKTYIEKQGYIYTCIWECEFDKHIREDENIKKFIDSLDIVTPLEPRDAFAGGRTEAFNLYHESSFDESIKYYDVTSLYPYINKTGKAVIGHPRIVTENFDDLTMYEGLIKCKVYPPRGLHIPVLPAKINNKLMFSLCRTCTEIKQQTTCRHGNEERSFTGTWVTDELKMAVNKGYILSTIYEVWHFDEVAQYDPVSKTGGIFTEYINTFLKMKQEASGWPSWCITKEHRQHYIQDYYEKEGILLDYNKIEKNPGLRALAKLMLNSFWGKFGQRTNLPQVDYVSDPSIFFDMLTSDQQEVTGVNFVTDEMVEMRWRNKAEFVESSGRTNVVLAAYTTSQARLKLYSYLEQLGQRVLYADTDSIVFTVKEGEWEPSLGDYLGDLTDEVPENKITHFVTGGPKNYAYKLHKPDDRGNQTICKVRGVTLNYKNALSINFETVREMVTNGSQDDKITVWDENKITRDKQNTRIITSRESKDYKIVFDKRVITEKFITKPYGY
ncbi:unnamed protein product [Mytilus edulis]|uniref:DNA-directed DNA polymerase n=1 Tax=Mytilus edulis TaxID=6550 RepID=A0A8S3PPA3_MYTED|nr:unnamed protein product [Mytilus edulis]